MSKKARNWSRAKRRSIRKRSHLGIMKARRRRQDEQHQVELQRKWARFADMMEIAMRNDPDRVGDDVFKVNPRRDDLSR